MSCERVELGQGARAIVCGRGRPSRGDLAEVASFRAWLGGDPLAYQDPAEEAAILEDVRRQAAAPVRRDPPVAPGQCPDCRWNDGHHHPACKRRP